MMYGTVEAIVQVLILTVQIIQFYMLTLRRAETGLIVHSLAKKEFIMRGHTTRCVALTKELQVVAHLSTKIKNVPMERVTALSTRVCRDVRHSRSILAAFVKKK